MRNTRGTYWETDPRRDREKLDTDKPGMMRLAFISKRRPGYSMCQVYSTDNQLRCNSKMIRWRSTQRKIPEISRAQAEIWTRILWIDRPVRYH